MLQQHQHRIQPRSLCLFPSTSCSHRHWKRWQMAQRQTQTLTQTADAVHRQPRVVAFDDLEIKPQKKIKNWGGGADPSSRLLKSYYQVVANTWFFNVVCRRGGVKTTEQHTSSPGAKWNAWETSLYRSTLLDCLLMFSTLITQFMQFILYYIKFIFVVSPISLFHMR